jgi:hypothetical protein
VLWHDESRHEQLLHDELLLYELHDRGLEQPLMK